MAAEGFEQWIQQAGSVPPTKVAVLWLASWAGNILLHGLWEAMTQFSVGVLPPWRHDIVISHPGEQPAVQKEITSDRKGRFFHIAFYSEGERGGQNKWAVLPCDLTPQWHCSGWSCAVIFRPVRRKQGGRDTLHYFSDFQFVKLFYTFFSHNSYN